MTTKVPPYGMSDFIEFMNKGQREWLFLVVSRPVKEVAQSFASYHHVQEWDTNTKKRIIKEDDYIDLAVPIIEILNSEWSVILRELYGAYEVNSLHEEAKFLAGHLKTKVITCVEEDTSGSLSYNLYEEDNHLESISWMPGFGLNFRSGYREKPNISSNAKLKKVEDYVNKIFCEAGIYIPACHVVSDDGELKLATHPVSKDVIGKVELINLVKY
jgi:hypothetical protein